MDNTGGMGTGYPGLGNAGFGLGQQGIPMVNGNGNGLGSGPAPDPWGIKGGTNPAPQPSGVSGSIFSGAQAALASREKVLQVTAANRGSIIFFTGPPDFYKEVMILAWAHIEESDGQRRTVALVAHEDSPYLVRADKLPGFAEYRELEQLSEAQRGALRQRGMEYAEQFPTLLSHSLSLDEVLRQKQDRYRAEMCSDGTAPRSRYVTDIPGLVIQTGRDVENGETLLSFLSDGPIRLVQAPVTKGKIRYVKIETWEEPILGT